MSIIEIRKKLTTMKIHLDRMDNWNRQACNMIYQIEEEIFDLEDQIYQHEENAIGGKITQINEAATSMQKIIESPPRHPNSSRSAIHNIGAAGFLQSVFN